MSNTQLFIPEKIKVGFNTRPDTYTGKLGYVIYHDGKVWRKEKSWESWREKYVTPEEIEEKRRKDFETRVIYATNSYNSAVEYSKSHHDKYYRNIADKTIDQHLKDCGLGDYSIFRYHVGKQSSDEGTKPVEFKNEPTSGFVLNKKAGGTSTGWNHRQTYCRVYDPRGFEFEISIPNLLFVLAEASSFKGKGLDGEFVYSWDVTELVLLPVDCLNYNESVRHTELQSKSLSVKDLEEGCGYLSKKGENLIYLGKFDFNSQKYSWSDLKLLKKAHIFADSKGNYIGVKSMETIAEKTTDKAVSNYAELFDSFSNSNYSAKQLVTN